jgi:hypothetical protein
MNTAKLLWQSHLTHAAKKFLGYTPKQLLSVPQIA